MLKRLQFLTAGESHGKGLLGILDGLPAGLEITEEYIDHEFIQIPDQQNNIRKGIQFLFTKISSKSELTNNIFPL